MDQGLLTTLGRRSAQRICVRCDVGILDESSGERTLGRLRDLSSNGCCVRTRKPLPIGTGVRLAFEFNQEQEPVRLHAEVVWSGRDDETGSGALAGLRFLDLSGADFGRLRAFIDRKLWAVQQFLCGLETFADMNDLEKLLLASISFDLELAAGETLGEAAGENVFVIVRTGSVACEEVLHDGRRAPLRMLGPGDTAGTPPVDHRGSTRIELSAVADSAVLVVPAEGFWYLWSRHAETALKLLSCWCLSLRDRLLAAEPA